MTTDDLFNHDRCKRFATWTNLYQPLRVSINYALNEAIHAALGASDPIRASEKMMALAANPGIDIATDNLYTSVIHHSHLTELLATYLISVDKCSVPEPINTKWGTFQPRSFLTPDGRLRRIVLVDRWTPEREQVERFSWRTAADCAITNLPMLLNIIIIGGMRGGMRPSPWTLGYVHPQNGGVRVQRREGEFGEGWKKVYREQASIKPLEWLRIMQSDGAFDGRVISIVEDVPKNRGEVLGQIERMAGEIGSLHQTRSACYRFTPCPFLSACASVQSPAKMGWVEKSTPSLLKVVS